LKGKVGSAVGFYLFDPLPWSVLIMSGSAHQLCGNGKIVLKKHPKTPEDGIGILFAQKEKESQANTYIKSVIR
jgi:hypothetical protein